MDQLSFSFSTHVCNSGILRPNETNLALDLHRFYRHSPEMTVNIMPGIAETIDLVFALEVTNFFWVMTHES